MTTHCNNLQADRKMGEYWERMFCVMMADRGKMFTPMQIGHNGSVTAYSRRNGEWNRCTLPDVTVWTAPGEHHELKHKTANRYGSYGLEQYRLNALLAFARETGQAVFYTIHDHNGNRNEQVNRPEDWLSLNVWTLSTAKPKCFWGNSYVNGKSTRVPILYWPKAIFKPLFVV